MQKKNCQEACQKGDFDFDNRLKQALDVTKDIKLESMHRKDVELLNLMMHEKSDLLQKSFRFHYGKLAELFGLSVHEIRQLDNAEQVLEFVAARKKDQFAVADLLDKLVQCAKCYDVLRRLVDQIVERQ